MHNIFKRFKFQIVHRYNLRYSLKMSAFWWYNHNHKIQFQSPDNDCRSNLSTTVWCHLHAKNTRFLPRLMEKYKQGSAIRAIDLLSLHVKPFSKWYFTSKILNMTTRPFNCHSEFTSICIVMGESSWQWLNDQKLLQA